MTARRGMTLLELLVVLAIGGAVLAVGYATFATVIDRRDQAARVAAEEARVAGIRRTLVRWLDGARPQAPEGSIGGPSVTREVRVTTRASTPVGARQTSVRLFVEDRAAGGGLVAILRATAGDDSLRLVLDPGARSMAVEYLVADGERRAWLSSEALQAATPVAVRLRIASDDPVAAAAFALPIEAPTAHAR
jgi:prepilin-type N-terminal cleavage/methylation domain-containing protein